MTDFLVTPHDPDALPFWIEVQGQRREVLLALAAAGERGVPTSEKPRPLRAYIARLRRQGVPVETDYCDPDTGESGLCHARYRLAARVKPGDPEGLT